VSKNLPDWAFRILSVVGVVLAASMVLNWISVGGHFTKTGLGLAWDDNHWLFLVPIAGIALAYAAGTKSEFTRLAAIAAGIVIAGDVLFEVAKGFIHADASTWLIFGGAGAILAGVNNTRRIWRVVGGLAVLAGFFAPWADYSMWDVLTSLKGGPMTIRLLWLIPLAGIAAIATANRPDGAKVALASGIAIYGSILWVILWTLNMMFGWGAWAALGASSIALVIGVLAPAAAPKAIPQPKTDAAAV
jgi:hypothetical protein